MSSQNCWSNWFVAVHHSIVVIATLNGQLEEVQSNVILIQRVWKPIYTTKKKL